MKLKVAFAIVRVVFWTSLIGSLVLPGYLKRNRPKADEAVFSQRTQVSVRE